MILSSASHAKHFPKQTRRALSIANKNVSKGPARRGDESIMRTKLSTSSEPTAIPYFLWDDPMTNADLKRRLETASEPERIRLLAKIMRQARDTDVWRFTTPTEVAELWDKLKPMLGRRLAFWDFLLDQWQRQGLIDRKQA